ncbi:Homeodomain-like DNA binding domain-containing transcription factor [Gigaspora margarita]|uniref:Homeodomain-like DNA binding domain-containing transcription factor n=1 Tax=Gigaspora margarita TaxID=4874 RepID=A0A8H3X1T6_GIGMA|nr:Homeodomain-like DNA binding domain-containing transcription factor [Gigaspora margarita]
MYSNSNEKKLRTFCPVVLFHEPICRQNEFDLDCVSHPCPGDEEYNEMIKNNKKRVDDMLNTNSQYWRIVIEDCQAYEKNKIILDRDSMMDTTQSLPLPSSMLSNSIYSHHHHISQDHQTVDGALIKPPKRRRGNLPKSTTALLKNWLAQHKKHPYPTEEEKSALAKETRLSLQQISNWFINARRRHLPHLLESDFVSGNSMNSRNSNEIDIYPYETSENSVEDSASDNGRFMRRHNVKTCARIQKTGAIKKLSRRKPSL